MPAHRVQIPQVMTAPAKDKNGKPLEEGRDMWVISKYGIGTGPLNLQKVMRKRHEVHESRYGAEDIRTAQAQARLGDHLRMHGEYDEAEEHLYVFSNSELERIFSNL